MRPLVGAIDDQVDLAVIVTPATVIPDLVEEGADLGIKHFLVISAGFKEIGGEGVDREQRSEAHRGSPRAVDRRPELPGHHQYGRRRAAERHVCRAYAAAGAVGLDLAERCTLHGAARLCQGRGIGFSRFVSFGNKVDVTEIDLLFALAATRTPR